jgi:cyclophilin family peptidyl-prolyl cis-trans isomerase
MLQARGFLICVASLAAAAPAHAKTMAEVLAASEPSDWRPLDPANTLYVEWDAGRVVIELAPEFAPGTIANVKTLVQQKYFDGLAFIRSQDNYVVQWGDPAEAKRSLGAAKKTVPAEFSRAAKGLTFTPLNNVDAYAPETGFVGSLPAARDAKSNSAWLAHCYGMVGVGRDNAADTANGSEIYVVIGHGPRHLDRNVPLIGRVVQGMDLLSVIPRSRATMGFYEKAEERTPLRSVRLASDVPEAERSRLEVLRSDTQTFTALIEARRNRTEEWFLVPAGHIDVCNVPLPVRERAR